MNKDNALDVWIEDRKVGTLAVTSNHLVAFEYDSDWLLDGFSISPLSLPLEKGVFIPKRYDTFEGLFGVFADSLPDGWGRKLTIWMCCFRWAVLPEAQDLKFFIG